MVLVVVCARGRRARHRRARPRGQGRDRGRDRRLGRDRRSRCCSSSASRTSRSSATRSAPRRCRAARSAPALLAALAVGGWVFIGFDALRRRRRRRRSDAARHVPRAIWIALLSVGALVILNAVAVTLAHPDPAASSPATTSTRSRPRSSRSFGSWSDEAVRRGRARRVPRLRRWRRRRSPRARSTRSRATACCPARASCAASTAARSPIGAIVVTTVVALPRPAARAELGRGRQPDRVRHRGDLRRRSC